MSEELTPQKKNKLRGIAAQTEPANSLDKTMSILAWARSTERINLYDPEELAQRTNDYFEFCAEHGIIPLVETYCSCLHISKQSFENYIRHRVRKMPQECIDIFMDVKQQILSIIAGAAFTNSVNPVLSMFYLKVHGRYDDQPSKDVPQTDDVDEENRQTAQDIIMKYQDIPDDE